MWPPGKRAKWRTHGEGSCPLDSIVREIRSDIEAIESNTELYEETNFGARVKALDRLEFDVAERIEELLLTNCGLESLAGLKQYAEMVRGRLERVDEGLFQTLRQRIASGDYTSSWLRQQLVTYAGGDWSDESEPNEGYDSLDALVHGLLLAEPAPEEVRQREPEMVPYQPTPARIVLEMVDKTDFRPDDVFYDIGSGLGQVAVLVHLLSGARTRGLEVEPAYCHYARRCARGLNLSHVEFINVDAREADYSDGTIFFLYTPFEGGMLDQVLGKLRDESRKRSIRLYTYGPCTLLVSQQAWLERVDHNGDRVDRLATFRTPDSHLGNRIQNGSR
jgi:hypothetical protein